MIINRYNRAIRSVSQSSGKKDISVTMAANHSTSVNIYDEWKRFLLTGRSDYVKVDGICFSFFYEVIFDRRDLIQFVQSCNLEKAITSHAQIRQSSYAQSDLPGHEPGISQPHRQPVQYRYLDGRVRGYSHFPAGAVL